MAVHPLVLAALRRDLGEAEFKLRRLESELASTPAGARSSMSTLRLHKRTEEARQIHSSWSDLVRDTALGQGES